MRKERKKGFTLVEVVAVLVVLGVMAAITVPALLGYIDKGKEKECQANREALLQYYATDKVIEDSKKLKDLSTPDFTIEAEIANHPEISCPSGGEYSGDVQNGIATVTCSIHGTSTLDVVEVAKTENPTEPGTPSGGTQPDNPGGGSGGDGGESGGETDPDPVVPVLPSVSPGASPSEPDPSPGEETEVSPGASPEASPSPMPTPSSTSGEQVTIKNSLGTEPAELTLDVTFTMEDLRELYNEKCEGNMKYLRFNLPEFTLFSGKDANGVTRYYCTIGTNQPYTISSNMFTLEDFLNNSSSIIELKSPIQIWAYDTIPSSKPWNPPLDRYALYIDSDGIVRMNMFWDGADNELPTTDKSGNWKPLQTNDDWKKLNFKVSQ